MQQPNSRIFLHVYNSCYPESGKVIFMFSLGDPAVFELDDVKILEAELPEYMVNTNFDPTWLRFFTNSWEGTVKTLT